MTESTFIALHTQTGSNILNIPGRLHLNVNPVNENSSNGVIVSAIVHVNAYSIDGNTEIGYTSIETVLQQVENIQFTFHGDEYALDINTTTFYSTNHAFYYFTIDPIYITNIFAATIGDTGLSIENVTFTPYLAELDFAFSDANTLFSNASEQRESTILMQSDRSGGSSSPESTGVLPSNIEALLNETADKAQVQDSTYNDTGWSRARYKGSKTDPDDNAGISPALSGRSFKGESFSKDATTDYICQLDDRIKQEFFHDGKTQLPKFAISAGEPTGEPPEPVEITTLISNLDGGNTQDDTVAVAAGATTLFHSTIPLANTLYPGDIITLTTPSTYGEEYMRVISSLASQTEVERDVYRTRIPVQNSGNYYDYPTQSKIYKLEEYVIYTLDTTGQSRLNSVGNSRIYVEGNNSIIETNKAGLLTSSSFCPVFINYIESNP